MIDRDKITLDWITLVSGEYRNTDKILVEKVIRALLLVEGLVKLKLPFVFKGGTALMLHFNSSRRLSIDIDIIISERLPDLDKILDEVATEQGFLRKEVQERYSKSKIDKVHYKFYYRPLHKTINDEAFVLLDILFEKVRYKNLVEIKIHSPLLPEIGPPLFVKSASPEDLLADKLTAYAPHTSGIPYFKGKVSMSMEIIKQLYDIGNLFDTVTDQDTINITFRKLAGIELEYRGLNHLSAADVLDDIFQTSLCIASRGLAGKGNFGQLQKGIQRISGFIFSESYHIEKAIIHASKGAYLACLIRHDARIIEKYANPLAMKEWMLGNPVNTKLNKLKKSNPEAFFYWYKIYELGKKT